MTGVSAEIFIQWKGTDVCLDFYCVCGKQGHVDGDFVYALKCGACGLEWAMPCAQEPLTIPVAPFDSSDPYHKPQTVDMNEESKR